MFPCSLGMKKVFAPRFKGSPQKPIEAFWTETTVQSGPLELKIHTVIFGGSALLCCSAASGDEIRREITKITAPANIIYYFISTAFGGIRISKTSTPLQRHQKHWKKTNMFNRTFCRIVLIYFRQYYKAWLSLVFRANRFPSSQLKLIWIRA